MQVIFKQSLKDLVDVTNMFLERTRENQDVINVGKNKDVKGRRVELHRLPATQRCTFS